MDEVINDAKDGEAFLFVPDCKVCVSHTRDLFICSEAGEYVTLLTHYVITMTTQLKQTITI